MSFTLGQICLFLTGILYMFVGPILPATNADLETIQAAETQGDPSLIFNSAHIVFTLFLFLFFTIGIFSVSKQLKNSDNFKGAVKIGYLAFILNIIQLITLMAFPILEFIAGYAAYMFIFSLGYFTQKNL